MKTHLSTKSHAWKCLFFLALIAPIAPELSGADHAVDKAVSLTLVQAPAAKKKTSIAIREKWTADTFFGESESIALAQAIASGNIEELQELVKSDAKLHQQGKHGFTLLQWAYVNDNFEAFELLLEAGADPDTRMTESISTKHKYHASQSSILQKGDTVLFTIVRSALSRDQDKFLDAAISKTKDINIQDADGDTLLLVCANMLEGHYCDEETIAKLAKAGADLNAMNTHGGTAASLAIGGGRYLVGVRVWEEGGDPKTQLKSKHSALDFLRARIKRFPEELKYYSPRDRDRVMKWLD